MAAGRACAEICAMAVRDCSSTMPHRAQAASRSRASATFELRRRAPNSAQFCAIGVTIASCVGSRYAESDTRFVRAGTKRRERKKRLPIVRALHIFVHAFAQVRTRSATPLP